jgi:putative endonuclease
MTQCWWLHLPERRDGRTYAGIATDVATRSAAHSNVKGAKFTRSNPPVRVLGARAFASKYEALETEAVLKRLDRTEKLVWARKYLPVHECRGRSRVENGGFGLRSHDHCGRCPSPQAPLFARNASLAHHDPLRDWAR